MMRTRTPVWIALALFVAGVPGCYGLVFLEPDNDAGYAVNTVSEAESVADTDWGGVGDSIVDSDGKPPSDIREGCWDIQELNLWSEALNITRPALGFGSDGTAWIALTAYRGDPRIDELQLLNNSRGGFWVRTIESLSTGYYSSVTSLVLDQEDNVHIIAGAVQNVLEAPMFYVVPEGKLFNKSVITSEADAASIAIAPDGTVQVAFSRSDLAEGTGWYSLHLAELLPDGSWKQEPIFEIGGNNRYPSLAASRDGTVHVAFIEPCLNGANDIPCSGDGDWAHHVWLDDDVWNVETIASDVAPVHEMDQWLALDQRDRLHVVYDSSRNGLRHAFKVDGIWRSEEIGPHDPMVSEWLEALMVIGSDGTIHVGAKFYDRNGRERVAWLGGQGEDWIMEVIPGKNVSYYSLALRPDGVPCIAYVKNRNTVRLTCRCKAFL